MGRILMTGGGGGADLDVITAEADDILSGKVIVDSGSFYAEGYCCGRTELAVR